MPLASGFRQRLIGLGRNPDEGTALAFRSTSVHTLGLSRPLAVAALDRAGRVLDSRVLDPNRVYTNWRAAVIVEWARCCPPPVGSRVALDQ